MFPAIRQRILIIIAVLLGAPVLLQVGRALLPTDGSTGITLLTANTGLYKAGALLILAAGPACLAAAAVSTSGHPLAGVFTLAASLTAIAYYGGPIDGWLWRSQLPVDYLALSYESVGWLFGWLIFFILLQYARDVLRPVWPTVLTSEHFGHEPLIIALPNPQAIASGLVAAALGGFLAHSITTTSQSNQVVGSLALSFTLAALVAQSLVPRSNPVVILLSPLLVAVAGYSHVLLRYSLPDQVLAAWYGNQLSGLALALPIFYASAGVAGAAMGVGLAHALKADPHPHPHSQPIPQST